MTVTRVPMSANTTIPIGDSSAHAAQSHGNPADKLNNSSSSTSNATGPSIQNASSLSAVRASLAALHARETMITDRLSSLLSSQADLTRELSRLDLLRANLGSQVIATRAIGGGMLSSAAETAGRLSSRVRTLDLEKERVQQTLAVVEQVAELKACVHGVVGSMGAPQDWEAAAAYLARASKVPEAITRGGFAAEVVPSVEVPDAPWVTLEGARESLCGLFLREFEKAAAEGDGAKVTRFFKLFPLIGRGDVGLDVYGRYVCQGVAGTARATLKEAPMGTGRKDGFFYASVLTKLFEHIAQIVESHGGLVERHYGEGKMVKVIERLQMEADVQGGIILDSWSDERGVDRRLTDVKSYPFSFLVQSFLPPQRGVTGTPRMNSPALGGGTNARNSEDEGVNMKEVDGLLSEIASPETSADASLIVPDVLTKSNLNRKVSAKLVTPYNVMSTFFFRRPIDGNAPYIISAVDDVMYIVSTVLQKSMSTSQKEVVVSVIPAVGRVLGSDFIGMVQRKMRDESYPKSIVQGGFPPEDRIVSFIVLINSLDVSNEYLARIIATRLGTETDEPNGAASHPSALTTSFPFESDAKFVTTALHTLNSSFSAKTSELLSEGLQVLFNNVVKLRLRQVMADTFRDADYALGSEEELAEEAARLQQQGEGADLEEADILDRVQRQFERGWDALMKPIARLLTPKTFASLMDLTARHLARVLEKRVWSSGGRASAYGAIRMERDFNGIIGIVARGNYALRELFARVTQVLMLVNMDDEEWEELAAESAGLDGGGEDEGMHWVLDEGERRRARNLVNG
ncbi:putative cog4 transporter protein [Eutypa lata UCREL1]|uniref:Conserved oligomeric Golgi complex subunit 4 n=1 Tax=Eutypa lata (strain UCR-EL1) TaxID=1287681 RepID=M7TJD6_EUTLA|nr:putative cog4 transporter protein [Eutypa lata UCREL1]